MWLGKGTPMNLASDLVGEGAGGRRAPRWLTEDAERDMNDKKLLVTGATLVVTGALLVVTRSY